MGDGEFNQTLADLLKAAGRTMAQNLKLKLVGHPGETGMAREQIVRDFLSDHLPKRYRVSTGFVFDCHGAISKQLDIVIIDAEICPVFQIPGGCSLFPCEAVVAAGEVKSRIASRSELLQALDGLIELKNLDRSANGKAFDVIHNEELDPVENYLHQIFTFLFVCGKAIDRGITTQATMDLVFETPIHQMPNVIFALDQYMVSYACDGGFCPNVMHSRGVSCRMAEEGVDILQLFYVMLGRAINVTRVASMPFWEYLARSQREGAGGFVIHDLYEYPPRHLACFAPSSRRKIDEFEEE